MQSLERWDSGNGEKSVQNAAESPEVTLSEASENAAERQPSLPQEVQGDSSAAARQREITELTQSIETAKQQLDATRERLGIPLTDEEPPSIAFQKEQLRQLQEAQEAKHEEEEEEGGELISEEEKERIIQEESTPEANPPV